MGVVMHFPPKLANDKITISGGEDQIETLFSEGNRTAYLNVGGPKWQNFNSRWQTAAILQNFGNAITHLPMDRFG